MDAPQLDDIFEPFDRLVEIDVCGRKFNVPENNSILRGLQFLRSEEISYGDFCWNGECLNCQVWIRNSRKEKAVMSCRTDAVDGMQIVRVSDEISEALSESAD
jgi:NADH dehydrogenase/NADH:ubiquinone oxidoreductase subunit G